MNFSDPANADYKNNALDVLAVGAAAIELHAQPYGPGRGLSLLEIQEVAWEQWAAVSPEGREQGRMLYAPLLQTVVQLATGTELK